MKNLFAALFVICGLGFTSVYGFLLVKKSVTKFDPDEFIFIGTVIGYTGPTVFVGQKANNSIDPVSATFVNRSEKPKFITYGLVVKVNESVYLPVESDLFEIFEYSLDADCLVQGISQVDLQDEFPLNSEVRVISKKAVLVAPTPSDRKVRLENRLTEDGSIALNADKNDHRMTSADTIFDYKAYSYDMNRDSDSKYLLPIFEIRKELFRLSRLKDQRSRNEILDRIFFAPVAHDIDHGGIFKNYTSSEGEYRRYFETHLKTTDPKFYLEYKAYQDALDRLLPLGFSKTKAENALGKALEIGTDIDARKLFRASLKFLPYRKHK